MSDTALCCSTAVRWFGEPGVDELPAAGGKAASLARLYRAGLPVPDGFVILPSAFTGDVLRPEAWGQTLICLGAMRARGPAVAFAVRSSASAEDSAQASFAGEFTTVLGVVEDDEVRAAIEKVHASRQDERVLAYAQARGLHDAIEVAVVVQRLVPSERSGVLFTANPVSGSRDEAIVNAVWGLGETIVAGLVTPDTLAVDKGSGRVLRRETADKQVMTVRVGGGTVDRPVPEARRLAPVLSDAEAAELVGLGVRIEALYKVPVDVEWAMVGERIAIVQARPITALPEQEPSPPAEWRLPAGTYAAVRNNIVELMADPLSPLFRTLGLAAVNASLHRVLAQFFGRKRLMPGQIIISVNDYAYFNGSLGALQILWLLWHSIGIARRMFRGAIGRWLDVGRPAYHAAVDQWRAARWREMPALALLRSARELTEAAVDAFGVLDSGAIPGAWISEGLFTFVYDKLVRRGGDPPATTYLLGYDSAPIRAEKSLYDLATWVAGRTALSDFLRATPTAHIAAALEGTGSPEAVPADDWGEWSSRFHVHLNQFGHAIYNLDFANPVPADEPGPLLATCKMYLDGQGVDPHTRQRDTAVRRERATAELLARPGGWRVRLCRRCLLAAQRFAVVREDGQADLGLAYPLVRQALRELGRRLAEAGAIPQADDVFWLTEVEATAAAARLDRNDILESLAQLVRQRKADGRAARRATPPLAIMRLRVLGQEIGRNKGPRVKRPALNVLRGVAASPGRVTATATVVSGPEDFARMRTGDVLVAPLTTPAWTPLFVRAAAIVTDVGGPLSHGSIVAREYGIPAVLGTGEATKRIRSGQIVTVDGSTGVVELSPD